ncbi:MAG: SdrD B-like domain-containing protein [Allosphingosinicella sp.]|uniref:SdrD B-like domain-containing protein n=1 Tax=Allosphingosinicella sp. TaxID=2823234 RepID=UPI00395E0D74
MSVTATRTTSLFQDNDGDGRVDAGDILLFGVTIANTGSNLVTGIQITDNFPGTVQSGSIKITPVTGNDAFSITGNTPITLSFASLTGNDYDPDGGAVTITSIGGIPVGSGSTVTVFNGIDEVGTLSVNWGAQTFTFVPKTGLAVNSTPNFTYTIKDADDLPANQPGTVTFTIANNVWYVNADASSVGADGSYLRPFTSLAPLNGLHGADDFDAAGDTIFVYNSTTALTGGIQLEANQKLYGGGQAFQANGITISTGAANSTINHSVHGVMLDAGNEVRGINFHGTSTGAVGIVDGNKSVGNLTIANVAVSGQGQILDIDQGGTVSIQLNSASSTGTSVARGGVIDLNQVQGTFVVTGATSITGSHVQTGIDVTGSGSAIGVTLGGAVTVNAGGNVGINFSSNTDATFVMNGAGVKDITSVVNGINIQSNFGATNFGVSGGTLDVYAGAGHALNIQGNVAVNATVSSNVILNAGGGGNALNVQGNSGAGNLTFSGASKDLDATSGSGISFTGNANSILNFSNGGLDVDVTSGRAISASGGGTLAISGNNNTAHATTGSAVWIDGTSSGGITLQQVGAAGGEATGIYLRNAGTGGFAVTGTGTTDGTGGSITGKTHGTHGVTTAGTGVYLENVSNISLKNMNFSNMDNYGIRGQNVNNFTLDNSNLTGFHGNSILSSSRESAIRFDELTGNANFTDNLISGGYQHNLMIDNNAGTLNLNVLRNDIKNTHSSVEGDDGIHVEAGGTSTMFINASNNIFTSHGGDHFNLSLLQNSNVHFTFKNNDMQNGHVNGFGGGVFVIAGAHNGSLFYDISNNGTAADPMIGHRQGGAIHVAQLTGTGTFNGTIANNFIGNASVPLSGSEQGMGIYVEQRGNGTHTALVTGNTVRQWYDMGMVFDQGEGSGRFNLTVTNNSLSHYGHPTDSGHGLRFNTGILSGSAPVMYLDARNNNVATAGNEPNYNDISLRATNLANVHIAGHTGGNSAASAASYLQSVNTATTSAGFKSSTATIHNLALNAVPQPTAPTVPAAPSSSTGVLGGDGYTAATITPPSTSAGSGTLGTGAPANSIPAGPNPGSAGPFQIGQLYAGKSVTLTWLEAVPGFGENRIVPNFVMASSVTGLDGGISFIEQTNEQTLGGSTTPLALDLLTLGNLIFHDANFNGQRDAGEAGIGGVSITLFADDGDVAGEWDANDTEIGTTTTDASGNYKFEHLAAGDYLIRLNASNFVGGGALATYYVTLPGGEAIDPNNNDPNDSNGYRSGGVVLTRPIRLDYGQEPGGSVNNTLNIGMFAPVFNGTAGPDTFQAPTNDPWTIYGNAGNDVLTGGLGNDHIYGGEGDDIIDGGAGEDDTGTDKMWGGPGNDTFIVDSEDDEVYEFANEGFDTIFSRGSYTLLAGSHIEALRTTAVSGTAPVNFTGNEFDNSIFGNAGNNILRGMDGDDKLYGLAGDDELFGGDGDDLLDGGPGDDILRGGRGNDTYIVSEGDTVLEDENEGIDTVFARTSFTLTAGSHVEILRTNAGNATTAINLTGNEFANTIHGNAGANELRGMSGDDVLFGHGGDDELHGGDGDDQLNGGDGNDRLYGGAGIDQLFGGAGNDLLDGGAGDDIMRGGSGDDTYFVDSAGDQVIELAGEGYDTVRASVDYVLAATTHVEALRTTDSLGTDPLKLTGNNFANEIEGNAGDNELFGLGGNDVIYGLDGDDKLYGGLGDDILYGGAGNDLLDGGAGSDTMYGGAGDDTYIVDNPNDVVIEHAGEGHDTIFSRGSYTLAAGSHVEVLRTTSVNGTTAVNFTGNELANAIFGNAGSNVLRGMDGDDYLHGQAGDDHLYGGAGNDTLVGGTGADNFYFDTALDPVNNVDAILDFNVADDTIHLDRAIFTGIGSNGVLDAGAFRVGTAAADADDRIIYNSATGQIFYDADGAGGADAILFATVSPNLALTHLDFVAYTGG